MIQLTDLLHAEAPPEVVSLILSETDGESVMPAFASHYFTLFIADLPFPMARRTFECVLLLGLQEGVERLIAKAVIAK